MSPFSSAEVEITIEAPSRTSTEVELFTWDTRFVANAYGRLAARLELPSPRVRAILADDFVEVVTKWMPARSKAEEGESFTTMREGGVVAAKNLDQSGDMSDVVIVFNSVFWAGVSDDSSARADGLHTIAHELAHPIIDHARYASGSMEGVLLPSVTGTEIARSMARILVAEYRADILADLMIGGLISMTVDGEQVPFAYWLPNRDRYLGHIQQLLEDVGQRWPDTVQEYREWRLPLEKRFGAVAASIDQTLTVIVHAQAASDGTENSEEVLAHPAIAGLVAVRLYLGEPIHEFLTALRSEPTLPSLLDSRVVEGRLVDAGERMIKEIWRRLGLTVLDHGDRTWGIKVGEPLR